MFFFFNFVKTVVMHRSSIKFFVVLLAADTVCEVFDALLKIIYCPYLQYEFVPIIYVT